MLFIGLLLGASLWILRPFLGPAIWATMVVVATWPVMRRVQALLWGKRALAVTAMVLLLLLLFVVPLVLAIVTIVDNADEMVAWARVVTTWRPGEQPPEWLRELPWLGGVAETLWGHIVGYLRALGFEELMPRLTPYAGNATRWFVAEVGSIGLVVVQFLLTVAIAGVMYSLGEKGASHVRRFALRLAGERGAGAVQLAGDAIRGVALGVGVTAVVQSVVAGVALALAGIPFAGLLTALMFMLCIAQVGPLPVLVPALVWAFYDGHPGWGTFLVVIAVVVTMLDNVLRPLLIRMGADLPLLLIFAGVIGGLFAFGLVGIFVGPVVLAVGYAAGSVDRRHRHSGGAGAATRAGLARLRAIGGARGLPRRNNPARQRPALRLQPVPPPLRLLGLPQIFERPARSAQRRVRGRRRRRSTRFAVHVSPERIAIGASSRSTSAGSIHGASCVTMKRSRGRRRLADAAALTPLHDERRRAAGRLRRDGEVAFDAEAPLHQELLQHHRRVLAPAGVGVVVGGHVGGEEAGHLRRAVALLHCGSGGAEEAHLAEARHDGGSERIARRHRVGIGCGGCTRGAMLPHGESAGLSDA
ncbi:MAG: AI-2E family transporter YdiK [Rubrivivax sp.]